MENSVDPLNTPLGCIYIAVGLTAITGNTVNLINFLKYKKLKTINNTLLMMLAFNDFSSGIIIICFSAFQFDPNFGPTLDAIQCNGKVKLVNDR